LKGSITQHRGKHDSWRLFVSGGIASGTAKRLRVSEVFHGKKRDAQRRLRELIGEVEVGGHRGNRELSVTDYLWNTWLPVVRSSVRATTAEGYEAYVRRYIEPGIGKILLTKLGPEQIQAHYGALLDLEGDWAVSRRTTLHAHRILKRALSHAVNLGLIIRNPCDSVTPPKPERLETKVLDPKEVDKILRHLQETESWAYVPVFLAAYTGMRRSEILALQWRDIDLDAGSISIRRSYHALSDGTEVVSEPKSTRGSRQVALTVSTIEMLREHRDQMEREAALFGVSVRSFDYLIHTVELREGRPDSGLARPYRPRSLSQIFRRTIRSLGIPGIRFHDLRHTHASLMLQAGIHPKIVSERLGHSNIGITLDLYSHVVPGLQERAVEQFESLMSNR